MVVVSPYSWLMKTCWPERAGVKSLNGFTLGLGPFLLFVIGGNYCWLLFFVRFLCSLVLLLCVSSSAAAAANTRTHTNVGHWDGGREKRRLLL